MSNFAFDFEFPFNIIVSILIVLIIGKRAIRTHWRFEQDYSARLRQTKGREKAQTGRQRKEWSMENN